MGTQAGATPDAHRDVGLTALIKTSSGHVQQSPPISIASRQLELMDKYMAELGLPPAARTRLDLPTPAGTQAQASTRIERVIITPAEVVEEASPAKDEEQAGCLPPRAPIAKRFSACAGRGIYKLFACGLPSGKLLISRAPAPNSDLNIFVILVTFLGITKVHGLGNCRSELD